MAGVDNIVESLDDLERVCAAVIALAKSGGTEYGKYFSLVKDLIDFAKGIAASIPEVKDLDAAEATLLLKKLVELAKKLFGEVVHVAGALPLALSPDLAELIKKKSPVA